MSALSLAAQVLLDLALIIVVTSAVGAGLRRLGQPAVVGEILAGIALGPSLIGRIPVAGMPLSDRLFPPAAVQQLTGIANVGLVLFMMVVGLELNFGPARSLGRRAATISVFSVLLPLVLGGGLGVWLFTTTSVSGSRVAFVLFVGVAMSVTAFPVLARILTERRLHRAPLGVLVLACAGVDDVLAWSLLALATAASGGGGIDQLLRVMALLAVFCAVLMLLVRPALRRLAAWHRRLGRLTPAILVCVLVGLFLSAAATELIGVHFVFGAFLFGAALPREDSAELVRDLLKKLEQVILVLLLPVFFVVTGMAVDLRHFDAGQLAILGAVLGVACAGKFLGAATAARLTGVTGRQSLAVGILMNTRGLTELVVVNAGYQAGLISRDLLTVFVVMAVVTTLLTKPLLKLVYPDWLIARDIADAERRAVGVDEAYRCLVLVDDPETARDRVLTARALAPEHRAVELVLSWQTPMHRSQQQPCGGIGAQLQEVGADLDRANSLAAEISSDDVTCSVMHRLDEESRPAVLQQIETLQPDCVVAGPALVRADEVAGELAGDAELLLVRRGSQSAEGHPVTVSVGGGSDAVAALVLAVRLARQRGVPLQVVDRPSRTRWSRADALVERLARADIQTRLVPDDPHRPGLLVSESDHPPAHPSLTQIRVRAGRPGSADDLVRLLGVPLATTLTPSRS